MHTHHDCPRDFDIDPSGQFVICGHQSSYFLTLFRRDQETGKLHILQDDFSAPEVVCVCFDNGNTI